MRDGFAELLGRLRRGEETAEQAVAERLALVRAAHERTGAVAFFEDERALSDARALDRAFAGTGPVGPLHGLPITVKDWIDVEGFPCAGETDDRERRPVRDAAAVARLRAAGAVVVAKTKPWGDVAHPGDPTRSVGGSSSGEAALVAAGASVLGIGSDSGGSIRLPASWAGVWGLRPTAGRVPTTGHYPRVGLRSDGRTQIGPLADSVDAVELALAVLAGPDGRDPAAAPVPLLSSTTVELQGRRIAVIPGGAVPVVEAAVRRAGAALVAAGAVEVEWTFDWLPPAWDVTRRYWARAGGEPGLTGADVMRELEDWDHYVHRYLRATADVDLIVTPATPDTAPLRSEPVEGERFLHLLPASLVGAPALAVPAGADAAGLPIGVQIVGRLWEDHVVLAAGRTVGAAVGRS
ncbi:amidase [Pseudonocardia sp. CA-107938]|uniref:amidase n=1 Tax=Pseudonocardia sp. CA-107938 TaxID=3240021 RepID=UPI003D935328